MKYNSLLAVISMLLGVIGATVTLMSNTFSTELITLVLTAFISSLLGLVGIYLFEKNYKISIVQYIICGLGILLSISILGVIAFIFYMITALVTFMEKEKSSNYFQTPVEDSHYYGDESEIRKIYDNFSQYQQNTVVYWTIPAATIIIILLIAVIGIVGFPYDNLITSDQVELTNITSNLTGEAGHYYGSVHATLSSHKDINNGKIRGCWYSSNGTLINESFNSEALSKMEANHDYQIDIPYDKRNIKPSKVEIQVYDNDIIVYSKNVTFN